MRRHIHRRPFNIGRRLRLSVVLIDAAETSAPPGAGFVPFPYPLHDNMAGGMAG